MSQWKEKVTAKIARIVAENPSASSTASADVAFRNDHQTISSSAEQNSSPKKSFLSSYVKFFLPASSSNSSGHRDDENSPCPKLRRGDSIRRKNKPSGRGESSSTDGEIGVKKDVISGGCDACCSTAMGTHENGKASAVNRNIHHHYLSEKSALVTPELFAFMQSCLPNIAKNRQWGLLYSTWKHGISLRTLLRKSATLPGPCLLVAGDAQGAIFGGLLESPLKVTEKRKYQGTNQTFLYTTIYGEPRLFRATGANRYYYLCLNDALAFGGGGSFALFLDEDLLHGTSGPCDTFGNHCLAHSSEFELKNVELWGFSHAWRYSV